MIGLPPTVGFISKWYLLQGALEVGQYFAVVVIALSTLLNAGYFLPIVYAAFLRPPDAAVDGESGARAKHGEAPFAMVAALTLTAICTVLLFWFPDVPLDLARMLIGRAP